MQAETDLQQRELPLKLVTVVPFSRLGQLMFEFEDNYRGFFKNRNELAVLVRTCRPVDLILGWWR